MAAAPVIVAIISAIASAAQAAAQIAQTVKGTPKIGGGPSGPTAADRAAQGLIKPDSGSVTPAFGAGLRGSSTTGPLVGAGSSIDKPLGSQADDFSRILSQFGGQGGGGANSIGTASMGGGGLGMGSESMDIG